MAHLGQNGLRAASAGVSHGASCLARVAEWAEILRQKVELVKPDKALPELYLAALADPSNEVLATEVARRFIQKKENDKAIGCENRIIRASRDGRYFRQFRKTVFCLDRFATYYLPDVSVGIASNGDSKAMKSTQAAPLAHFALCGCIAGP